MSSECPLNYKRTPPPEINTSFVHDVSSSPSFDQIVAVNRELRNQLSQILDDVESRCRRSVPNHRKTESVGSTSFQPTKSLKLELDILIVKIEKRRKELERVRQTSSLRVVEDQIRLKRKQLSDLQSDIDVLSKTALKQEHTLARSKTNKLIENLEAEIVTQKRIHSDLRRTSFDLEQRVKQRHRVTHRSTPSSTRSSGRTSQSVINEQMQSHA